MMDKTDIKTTMLQEKMSTLLNSNSSAVSMTPKLDAFSDTLPTHNSPNTRECFLRKEWSGRYEGLTDLPTPGKVKKA